MAQQKQTRLVCLRTWVQSMAPLSGLKIQCCHELWCRLAAVALIWSLIRNFHMPYGSEALKCKKKSEISDCTMNSNSTYNFMNFTYIFVGEVLAHKVICVCNRVEVLNVCKTQVQTSCKWVPIVVVPQGKESWEESSSFTHFDSFWVRDLEVGKG